MPDSCKIYRSTLPAKESSVERGALLGNFDGLHIGHQALIDKLKKWEQETSSREIVLISFYPHPLQVLRSVEIKRLASLRQKRALLSKMGVKQLLLMRFSKKLASVTASDFVHSILLEDLQIDTLFVGPDAAVGKGRQGDVAFLQEEFSKAGKKLEVFPFQKQASKKIGSALIREYLAQGLIANVQSLLGRPFAIEGRVVQGDQRGRRLGIPTANVTPGIYQLPKTGVYITQVTLEGMKWPAITNVGSRPTVDGNTVFIESHLLEYAGPEFYGSRIQVHFIARVRDEQAFESLEELKAAIHRDIAQARSYFKNGARSRDE